MNILVPKYLNFGADIKDIQFKKHKVIKTFKNNNSYQKTINFYEFIDDYEDIFPKLYLVNNQKLLIETENCGDLLNLFNVPDNWEKQINKLRKFFIKNQILILDIRFMPHTPYVINNLCTKNNKIYLVDLTLYEPRDTKYINKYFDDLNYTINLHIKYKNIPYILFPIHIYLKITWYCNDFKEKVTNYLNNAYYR